MKKEFLDNIENLENEIKGLKRRLKKIEEKECRVVGDSVQGSSKYAPYTKQLSGLKYPEIRI